MSSNPERAKLAALSKEELIDLVLAKGNDNLGGDSKQKGKKKPWASRPFDMSRYEQRHVALRVAYVGTNYYGFARQADIDETVHLIPIVEGAPT